MSYALSEDLIKIVVHNASAALCDYCFANNLHYVVTGASGGLDSSSVKARNIS